MRALRLIAYLAHLVMHYALCGWLWWLCEKLEAFSFGNGANGFGGNHPEIDDDEISEEMRRWLGDDE
jgi:hypothetical protein